MVALSFVQLFVVQSGIVVICHPNDPILDSFDGDNLQKPNWQQESNSTETENEKSKKREESTSKREDSIV